MSDLDRSVALDPKGALAFAYRGAVHAERGNHERSSADYSSAIELKPDFAAAYFNRGLAEYNLARYAEAVGDFTKAIDLGDETSTLGITGP